MRWPNGYNRTRRHDLNICTPVCAVWLSQKYLLNAFLSASFFFLWVGCLCLRSTIPRQPRHRRAFVRFPTDTKVESYRNGGKSVCMHSAVTYFSKSDINSKIPLTDCNQMIRWFINFIVLHVLLHLLLLLRHHHLLFSLVYVRVWFRMRFLSSSSTTTGAVDVDCCCRCKSFCHSPD